jgi:hypothetical protein
MTRALCLLALVGCSADPCEDVDGSCITLHVESQSVDRIDHLELDILYGDRHSTVTTSDGVSDLPVVTAIEFDATTTLRVGIVAAGKLSGVVLGTAADSLTLEPSTHAELTLELAPVAECNPAGLYCGGNKLAGDPDTLYACNPGGVPLARGYCVHGCLVRPPGMADQCDGGEMPCIEGGFYCGGDKLDGDPQSRYRCSGGVGVDRTFCPDGCVVGPPGEDDYCR